MENQFAQYHTHNSADGTPLLDETRSIKNTCHYFQNRLVVSGTNVSSGSTTGGDFVMPFDGYFVDVGLTMDTAGTTNIYVFDVLKNGTSIMSTKINIDSGEKTSRTAATPYVFKPELIMFSKGDIITVNVDQATVSLGKGLTFFATVIKTQSFA